MAWLEWQDANLRADFFQRRTFFRIQRLRSVIAAFDINRRAHFFEQASGADLRKNNDMFHAFEGGDHFRAIVFAVQRAPFTFERAYGIVPIDRDRQRVSQRVRGLEVTDMARMQEIEAAVREDELLPLRAIFFRDARELLNAKNFAGHVSSTINWSARGSTSNTAGSLPTSSPSTLNHIPGFEFTLIRAARR